MDSEILETADLDTVNPKDKKAKVSFWKNKKLMISIGSGILILVLAGLGFYFSRNKTKVTPTITQNTQNVATITEQPELFEAPLDGVMTDEASSERHPLAVIVENHPDARPQAGLNKASVVYEAIAEGGITRFLAVFGTNNADKVGPIRSARTYFVDWSEGYNAFLSHVGGNMDALDKIKSDKVPDLDQFAYSSPYSREGSGVATEHTMFSSTEKLWAQADKLNYPSANNFTKYTFKDDPAGEAKTLLPESQKLTIDFSNDSYKAVFDYDKTSNSYKRSLAGKSHVDKLSKEQIAPKNVVIMTVKRTPTKTRINEAGYNMATLGTGKADIFMDGKHIIGTWKKDRSTSREIFYDADSKEVTFNRGQTWISVIPPETGISLTVQ